MLRARRLRGIRWSASKVYGSPQEQPWAAAGTNITWDFSADALAMNIFLPDLLLRGVVGLALAYYLDINPDPNKRACSRTSSTS